MARDSNFNKEYFDKWIDFVQTRNIDHDQKQVATLTNDEGKAMCGNDLFKNSVQLSIMCYSRGDAIPNIRKSVSQMVRMLELKHSIMASVQLEKDVRQMYERLDLGTLYESLTLLAFMVSLHFPAQDILHVLALIDHAGEDTLLDKIAHIFGETTRKVGQQSKFPKIYNTLVEIIAAPPLQQGALLKKYVEGWYKRMKPIYWYGNHEGGEGAYFGYWCFEAALIAMLFKIDDSELANHPNYPADLVHYYRNPI